jgi:hypothetical protein
LTDGLTPDALEAAVKALLPCLAARAPVAQAAAWALQSLVRGAASPELLLSVWKQGADALFAAVVSRNERTKGYAAAVLCACAELPEVQTGLVQAYAPGRPSSLKRLCSLAASQNLLVVEAALDAIGRCATNSTCCGCFVLC